MNYHDLNAAIREGLIELIAQGRLTGDNILLDGQPLVTQEEIYRPDGYSIETRNGCRAHRLIDEALAEAKLSDDQYLRQAAENFPTHFTFNHTRYPELASDVQEERDLAIAARNRWFSMKWVLGHRNPLAMFPFETRAGFRAETCAVVLGLAQPNLPELFPIYAVGQLRETAAQLRWLAENG